MKIGVLTSSRADYGIYSPLLKQLEEDSFFDLNVIVFGTHLLDNYGKTINAIKTDGYKTFEVEGTIPLSDTPEAISNSVGKTISNFSAFWNKNKFDLIIALGDRYEMFGAVASTLPFNLKVVHIHGGETTLGAIDNSYRHSITLMSKLHFTSAEEYKNKVTELIGSDKNVFNVGALSIDNIKHLHLLNKNEIKEKFGIDFSKPSILFTFHPETVGFEKNSKHIDEIIDSLKELNRYQIIITMPNSDTMGLLIREKLNEFIAETSNAIGIESFGSLGYLSSMKLCSIMVGNTSSGFIEAAGFNKPVVNLGNRQKGRILTPNIFNSAIIKSNILSAINDAEKYSTDNNISIYGDGTCAIKIINELKNYANREL